MSIVLILDNIRSCHNVGSIFRTADGCGIKEIWLLGITPLPTDDHVIKTSLGAESNVDWRHFPIMDDMLSVLKMAGNKEIVSIEQTDMSVDLPSSLNDSTLDRYVVFGNEVSGVSEELLEISDHIYELPMRGIKKSLNVSVCAGIVMYLLSK